MEGNTQGSNANGINYEGIAQIAMKYALPFEKNLDYSKQSIEDLEEMLQEYYEDAQNEPISEKEQGTLSVIFGVYLGQTLLQNGLAALGYQWSVDAENAPLLRKGQDNAMYPVNKVYKRLQNGPEDSVKSFYDVAIAIGEGKLSLDRNKDKPQE